MLIRRRAHAKINLLLDVTGRLPNGYHSLAMINQSISLHDTVTVETTPGPNIELLCSTPGIPLDERNIAHKACKAFGLHSGLRITIEKRIPAEAGLAGGSANAAAVLAALRDIFTPGMPDDQLLKLALQVGADVPFCLVGGCCLVEGIGETLTPLPCLPEDYSIALAKPAFSVSTANAYAKLDQINFARPKTGQAIAYAKQGDWANLFPLCANVFEQAVDFTALNSVKQNALHAGALLTQMTGSGSAVFALFRRGSNPAPITQALAQLNQNVAIHHPVPKGLSQA